MMLALLSPHRIPNDTKYILYNAPIKRVPTSDNVRIDVDLSFVFQIGPALEQVNKFCYNLGISRFDEMLRAMTEETIRTLVLQVKYSEAYDLKEAWAFNVLDELKKRFSIFGVNFTQCKVTEVRLPPKLAAALS